ncbi:MAG TPA: hypothetical protein VKB69_14265, partial [Micromonosporaceae bacterium]|nr:hypothetical protein [Micromonosporaceae bacterium]
LAIDLTPYRERARVLVERVTAGELDADGLRVALTDLVDDLYSVGVQDPGIAGLETLLAALRAGSWSGDLEALRDFASGTAGQRKAFWKR